jgi:hypothetical protein
MALKKLRNSLIVMGMALMPLFASAQQTTAQIQAQEAAANAPQSAATTSTNETPWQTFQQYYAAWTSGGAKALFQCYTPTFQATELDGQPMPTDAQFTAIGNQMLQRGYSNFQIIGFVFTANAQKPAITVTISENDPQNNLRKEQLSIVMVDTPSGWLINCVTVQDLN